MSQKTRIEWTEATWNPVRGCSRVSEGCRHCYAEAVAARFSGPGQPYEGLARRVGSEARWTGKVRMVSEHLADPLRWKKPRRIFVNSMSDLFHEGLGFDEIAAVFGVMAAAPRHAFQVLTKRPQRALEFFAWVADPVPDAMGAHLPQERICDSTHHVMGGRAPGLKALLDPAWPLPNVWLGVSVEDQATADERIPLLLQCHAAVRFVSYEPALGPVDFTRLKAGPFGSLDALRAASRGWPGPLDYVGHSDVAPLDWIIVGGESGHGARPFDLSWARNTVAQCKAAGVPCFVKQLGAQPIDPWADTGHLITGREHTPPRFHDRKGGDWSKWPEDLRVREFPR